MDDPTATLLGVIITAIISILIMVVNYWITKQTLSHEAARDIGKTSLEIKIRQLNELYGPLLLLTEQNRILANKLYEGKVDAANWRLLDHIPEVIKNRQDKAIVDEIIKIDAKIEELIINKGGLVRSPRPPQSFSLFLGHYKILKLALEGKERPHVAELEYYPRKLNKDVEEAHQKIIKEIDDMMEKYEMLLKKETR